MIDALLAASGHAMPPVMRAHYEQSIAAVRESLGETADAAAWETGRAMPLDQTIADALEESPAA